MLFFVGFGTRGALACAVRMIRYKQLARRSRGAYSTPRERGFALIATISVMVLLVMIALAMLSLSSIELRQTGNISHQQKAKANARLALMIAIGDLQKYAGADQRVTARGDIVEDAVPEKAHWTGVWSTENWDSTTPNANKDFVGWLVSRSDKNPWVEGDVKNALSQNEHVTLVGSGSVGLNQLNEVQAEKVKVSSSGAYAYWIGDQGVKASSGVAGFEVANQWSKGAQLALAERVGLEALDVPGLENYADHSRKELMKSGLSLNTLDVLQSGDISTELFHDKLLKIRC